jgi:FixJ family two-component response regulator
MFTSLADEIDHEPSLAAAAQPMQIVFVLDEDIGVRQSLASLASAAGLHARTFESATEFLFAPRALAPSCLILGASCPGGLDLQKRIARERNNMPIIVTTDHGDVQTTVRAMKAGAVEVLAKPFSEDDMLIAVREALDRSAIALEQEAELTALRDNHLSLSRREREVMALIVSGLLNKQVGGELGISEVTVKAHRGQVMRKMQASSFADLVTKASKLGINNGRRQLGSSRSCICGTLQTSGTASAG